MARPLACDGQKTIWSCSECGGAASATCRARMWPAGQVRQARAAVLLRPQQNADAGCTICATTDLERQLPIPAAVPCPVAAPTIRDDPLAIASDNPESPCAVRRGLRSARSAGPATICLAGLQFSCGGGGGGTRQTHQATRITLLLIVCILQCR